MSRFTHFLEIFGQKSAFLGQKQCFLVKECTITYYICMPGAANTAGHALNHAYGRKLNGAEEECRRQGIAFLPIVAETFEGWHPEAGRLVKKLGTALARHTG